MTDSENETKYPATKTVQMPSGPVDACDQHAHKLIALIRFMGGHIVATPAGEGAECANCRNKAKSSGV